MSRGRFEDLTGKRFGRLTVLSKAESKNGHTYWLCRCDCGTEKTISRKHLIDGNTVSCGCYWKELSTKFIHRFSDDEGEARRNSRLYRIWQGMRNRCYNRNSDLYRLWGGRGITICDEWKDYRVFKEWAMGHGYKDGLSIDRINNNGDYEPGNCRWATAKQQGNNTRMNIRITVGNETHTVAEWSEITGIPRDRLYKRIKYGITGEDFLRKEKLTNVKRININQ